MVRAKRRFVAGFEIMAADHGLPKAANSEPPPNCAGPILKSMLLANAAVGKARAMSVSAISLPRLIRILILLGNGCWPHVNEAANGEGSFGPAGSGTAADFLAKIYWRFRCR